VGQRKGLGVATGNPLYVLQINGAERKVVVGSGDELMAKTLRARKLNWVSISELREPMRVKAKIRHRHEAASATIEPMGEEVLANFDVPQRAVTPGQAVVFYDGHVVVGGGWIA